MKCPVCKNENPNNIAKCKFCGYWFTKKEPTTISGPDPITNNQPQREFSLVEAIAYARKATVKIFSIGEEDGNLVLSTGTGFFAKYNGHKFIITNAHVVENLIAKNGVSYYINVPEVSQNQNKYLLDLLAYDSINDIAVCKANFPKPDKLNFLEIIDDADDLRQGEAVFTVGNPRNLQFSATNGIISVVNHPSDIAMNKVLLNMDTDHGNSGGAAVRVRDCKVVGITSAGYSATVDTRALNANVATITANILGAVLNGGDINDVLSRVCGSEFHPREWNSVTVDNYLIGQSICTSGEAIAMLLNEYLED